MTTEIKGLTFDVFGTVVDWRTAIIAELEALAKAKGIEGDWVAFVDEWKAFYRPAMDAVNSGARPWTNVDVIFREALDQLLPRYGLDQLSEAEVDHLNRSWCRPVACPIQHRRSTGSKPGLFSQHFPMAISPGWWRSPDIANCHLIAF